MKEPIKQIFNIKNEADFEQVALNIFRYQAQNCIVYKDYIHHLGLDWTKIKSLEAIPFLPVSFFKTHQVIGKKFDPEVVFYSSGTTGATTSKHFVADIGLYQKSFNMGFEQFYGQSKNYCILALLPSYLEREGSSLIYMVDALLAQSQHPDSGYFLHNHQELYMKLKKLRYTKKKTILIGVTYALLDFLDHFQLDFPELIVMETGGMKGKRKEMIREELHQLLASGFGVPEIHSEFGMTELLSQAYSKGKGYFQPPSWMKIVLRDPNDPLTQLAVGKTGGINIIDLANLYSCSFIATQDLGRLHANGNFEVLGRFDNSDIRGCNLLVN